MDYYKIKTSEGNSMNNEKKDNKRDLVLKKETGFKPIMIIAVIAAAAALIAAGYLYNRQGETKSNVSESKIVNVTAAGSTASADEIRYAVKDFADGKARFYNYRHAGTDIGYFILKSSDGKIRAAFDACDVCWESGKGYTQQGDYMICNNCGRKFISTMINVVTGGCNPSPLAIKVKGGEIVLKTSDIATGQKYFRGVKR